MTVLVLAAVLTLTPIQRCEPMGENSYVLIARTSSDLPELAIVNGCGDVELLRWCTPWDIVTAWLDDLPPRETSVDNGTE
jgi:hypothetical protein